MKDLTELAAEARRINAQMGDGFDYAIHTTVNSILAIESEVTALRERLAAAEADAEVILEHSGCGQGVQVNQIYVRLYPGDRVLLEHGPLSKAILDAARNPTKEG